MVDLWFVTRRYRSPFGGSALPCPGGPGDQPAALLDALALLDAGDADDGET